MDFIAITESTNFRNPVYGKGLLTKGKTYYTYTQFAQETARKGVGRIVEEFDPGLVHFEPSHLDPRERFKKVLLMFSGGFGDAVTVGSVLPSVMKNNEITFDICCASDKWHFVFAPMAFPGKHVCYPPDLEGLLSYDAVLTDITRFFPTEGGRSSSPLVRLCQGFHVDPKDINPRYEIHRTIEKKWRLPSTNTIRIGVNFDSKGLARCYPEKMRKPLVEGLRKVGSDVYVLGHGLSGEESQAAKGVRDLRGKTTVPELAALLKQMDLVLAVDSFVAHLSNLLGTHTLVLLSTTPPEYFDWHENITCLSSDLECSPCFEDFDTCPLGYRECRAFYHESILPEIIIKTVVNRVTDKFHSMLGR